MSCATRPSTLLIAALIAASPACAATDTGRAGFPEPPVTLIIAVADPPGRYTVELAEHFAGRLTALSDGALDAEVRRLPDSTERHFNQRLAKAVIAGDYDLGIVPANAWDALGVDSLRALYVPFLVDSDALIDAIATTDMARDLLAGLKDAHVEPLGLLPGGLRHFIGNGRAFASPDAFAGANLRVAYSTDVWSTVSALGAIPDDPNGIDVDLAIRDGRIEGADSMIRLADSLFDAPVVVADVTPHPHMLTLVANSAVVARMAPRLRDAMESAAAETVAWAAADRATDAEEAARLCARAPGATVLLAGAPAVDALRAAASEAAARLRALPSVGALAARVDELKASLPTPDSPAPCEGPRTRTASPPRMENVPPEFPEGRYRRHVTADALRAAGVDPSTAAQHAGMWELSFRDGRLEDPTCPGSTYEIVEGRLIVQLGPKGETCGAAAGAVFFSAGWLLSGRSLTFTDVRSGHGSDVLIAALIGGGSWARIS